MFKFYKTLLSIDFIDTLYVNKLFLILEVWKIAVPHSPQKETRNFLVAGFLFFGTTQAF
jgi:hypothetical protein